MTTPHEEFLREQAHALQRVLLEAGWSHLAIHENDAGRALLQINKLAGDALLTLPRDVRGGRRVDDYDLS